MSAKGNKKPKTRGTIQEVTRVPKRLSELKVGEDINQGQSAPCFGFSRLDSDFQGLWDWHLTPEEHLAFVTFLKSMAGLTWNEIRGQTTNGHKKHHDQSTDSLCKDARDRLWELGLGAEEQVFRFRLGGTVRLWGVFLAGTHELHILWWDRDHQVYPTET